MNPKQNPSLQKKSAARMAAVQCLYQNVIGKEKRSAEMLVAALKKRLANNKNEQKLVTGIPLEPNYALLEAILAGVSQWEADIDSRMEDALSSDWKRERMSPLLVAILQCAIFELFFYKDAKKLVVIDEYTRLTRSFFGGGEVNFVHGALAALSKKYDE